MLCVSLGRKKKSEWHWRSAVIVFACVVVPCVSVSICVVGWFGFGRIVGWLLPPCVGAYIKEVRARLKNSTPVDPVRSSESDVLPASSRPSPLVNSCVKLSRGLIIESDINKKKKKAFRVLFFSRVNAKANKNEIKWVVPWLFIQYSRDDACLVISILIENCRQSARSGWSGFVSFLSRLCTFNSE